METGATKNDGIFLGCLKRLVGKVIETACTAKKLGKDDPRRVVHSLKVGAALTLVSLLYYLEPLYDGFGTPGIWALMTVVVVFEFSVGATIGKGLNRGLATLLAGALGVGVHYVASLFGNVGEPIVIGSFVFLQAAISTFIRFFPGIKARYDYGFLIFILTFSMVSLSSVRDDSIIEFAKKRLLTILIGGFTCVMICTCICPVWAGEDLHNLVALNIEKLGNFLEGFGNEYFRLSEYEECNSEKSVLQAYKSVLTSKNTEEALANFARWEPGHGKFRFRHPWNQYLSIGSATRECAYRIEALTGCLNSEIQAQVEIKSKMQETCMKLSSECSKALKELASAVKKMTTTFSAEPHIEDSKDAANRLKSLMNSEVWKGRDLLDVIPAATVASLLIDVVICTERISSSVHDLASLAHFKSAKTKVSGSEKTEGSDLKIIDLPSCEDCSSVVITVHE